MGILIGANFDVNAALPIDSRMVVTDTTARDALAAGVRYQGLKVFVTVDQKTYVLKSGITNSDWSPDGGAGIVVAADNTARDAIASGDRYNGLLVYVVATRITWQLIGGITNSDWCPFVPLTFSISATTSITKQYMNGILLVDATGGSRTINLPDASTCRDMVLTIKKIDSTANTVIIDGFNSDQIDGALTYTIYDQYFGIKIVAHSSNWYRIGTI